jgi:hypothetical protein
MLTAAELTALKKLAEEGLKNAGELEPGSYDVDSVIHLSARIARAPKTEVAASFYMAKFMRPLILACAQDLGKEWLDAVLAVLPKIVKKGAEESLKGIDRDLVLRYDNATEEARTLFHAVAPKSQRNGNTSVIGTLEKSQSSFEV